MSLRHPARQARRWACLLVLSLAALSASAPAASAHQEWSAVSPYFCWYSGQWIKHCDVYQSFKHHHLKADGHWTSHHHVHLYERECTWLYDNVYKEWLGPYNCSGVATVSTHWE